MFLACRLSEDQGAVTRYVLGSWASELRSRAAYKELQP